MIGANRRATPVPRVVGRIRRKAAVEIRDAEFLVAHATHATKTTIPGPFTLAQQCQNEFYKDKEEMAMDFAVAVNEELTALKKPTGVDVVQLDEPWVRAAPDISGVERYAIKAIDRALQGVAGPTIVHICLGYGHLVRNKPAGYAFLPQLADCAAAQISLEAAQPQLDLGVLKDLSNKTILLRRSRPRHHRRSRPPTPSPAASCAGLQHISADRLVAAPDCGMKYLPRDVAFGKLRAMVRRRRPRRSVARLTVPSLTTSERGRDRSLDPFLRNAGCYRTRPQWPS